nr:TetR/AcrR family transcriptional regulator [Antrihabitans stalactiti]
MVARILAAAATVLSDRGYEGASTTRIAEEAGISPGSLYQYFPNKDAIIATIVAEFADGLASRAAQQMSTLMGDQPEVVVPTMINAVLEALAERRHVVRALVEQVPGRRGQALAGLESRVADLTRGYLTNRRELLGDTDPAAAAWLLTQTATSLSIRYVLDEPDISQKTFVTELSKMVLGYPNLHRLDAWTGQ